MISYHFRFAGLNPWESVPGQAVDILVDLLFVSDIAWQPSQGEEPVDVPTSADYWRDSPQQVLENGVQNPKKPDPIIIMSWHKWLEKQIARPVFPPPQTINCTIPVFPSFRHI